ncbi:MAG TPA: hypothetical protein V6D17_09870 [Candidatus Obscuribacterales bacterium]
MKSKREIIKIGVGALIVAAACGIMLPGIINLLAGIGRLVALIAMALAVAYVLNLVLAKNAINKRRKEDEGKDEGEGNLDKESGGI